MQTSRTQAPAVECALQNARTRCCAVSATALALAVAMSVSFAGPVWAQTAAAPAAAKTKASVKAPVKARDPAVAQTAIEQAEKLLEANKAEPAANALSAAISGGNLPPTVMARALYLRGIAQRRLQKPAQAISDLTSALWLKNGLNDQDRADAMKQRSAAYAEAGLADPGQSTVEAKPATRTPTAATVSAAVVPTPQPVAKVNTATASVPAPSPPATAAQPASQPATGGDRPWTGRGGKKIEPPTQAPDDNFSPQFKSSSASSEPSSGSPGSGGGVGNFFGSLFGGQQPAPAPQPAAEPAPAPVAVAPPPPPSPPAPKAAARKPAPTPPAAAPKIAAATAQPVAAPATSATSGSFRARVALVRTKAEADAVVAKLKSQYGPVMGGNPPVIDQTQFGNMGAFFQVRVGPYPSPREAQAACDKLKGSGLDCVPVNN